MMMMEDRPIAKISTGLALLFFPGEKKKELDVV